MARLSIKNGGGENNYYTLHTWLASALAYLMKDGQSISVPNREDDASVLEIYPDLVGRGAVISKSRGPLTYMRVDCQPLHGVHVFATGHLVCVCGQYESSKINERFEKKALMKWQVVEKRNG